MDAGFGGGMRFTCASGDAERDGLLVELEGLEAGLVHRVKVRVQPGQVLAQARRHRAREVWSTGERPSAHTSLPLSRDPRTPQAAASRMHASDGTPPPESGA